MAISEVTMRLNMDRYLRMALEEDITSEDVSANAVMDAPCRGAAELICKQHEKSAQIARIKDK